MTSNVINLEIPPFCTITEEDGRHFVYFCAYGRRARQPRRQPVNAPLASSMVAGRTLDAQAIEALKAEVDAARSRGWREAIKLGLLPDDGRGG